MFKDFARRVCEFWEVWVVRRGHHYFHSGPPMPRCLLDGLVKVLGDQQVVAPSLSHEVSITGNAKSLVNWVNVAEGTSVSTSYCKI
jgi:hypothetical protein